jgi:hypothetical protein
MLKSAIASSPKLKRTVMLSQGPRTLFALLWQCLIILLNLLICLDFVRSWMSLYPHYRIISLVRVSLPETERHGNPCRHVPGGAGAVLRWVAVGNPGDVGDVAGDHVPDNVGNQKPQG